MDQLKVFLEPKSDANGKTFYIGRLKAPIKILGGDGLAFVIFTNEEMEEELQIRCLDNKKHSFVPVIENGNRFKIKLVKRMDPEDKEKVLYLAKVKIELDCFDGVTFLVFNSKPGSEELQIELNKKE